MVRREDDFFVPTGASELKTGDQLLVITDQDADEVYQQIINEAEEEAQWREGVRRNARERIQRFKKWVDEKRQKRIK